MSGNSSSSTPVSPIGEVPPGVIKPWSCARARFVVKPPKPNVWKGGKRRRKLIEDKALVEGNLAKTPYIKFQWKGKDLQVKEMIGLVDTGADWSLMVEDELSQEERAELKPSNVIGQGVTKNQIAVSRGEMRVILQKVGKRP